ncbi:MAG: mechanosensitive ion channel family protein [Emticicia sp.]|uniref:mechanosensitive ion channel family protein n=1 Tax=Emticicia sp. TaxID=1930953 RepID=UPI003BA4E4FB
MNFQEVLNYSIIKIGAFDFRISSILGIFLLVIFAVIALYLTKRTIYRTKKIEEGKKYSLYSLFKYIIITFAVANGLQVVGLDISVILAGSAALLVGLGIGLQTLFKDFVSGIILLIDASIKVGDVIVVNDLVCKIKEIKLRTTTAITRDDKYIILPNSMLTSSQIQNWTHLSDTSRFEVQATIDYQPNIRQVKDIVLDLIDKNPSVLPNPQPFVRFTEFGESTLTFSVFFWTQDLFRVENISSDIRFSIFEHFNKHKIKIPVAQQEVAVNEHQKGL